MINDKSKIQGVWNHRAILSIFISVKDMYLISITKFQIDCHQYLRIRARLTIGVLINLATSFWPPSDPIWASSITLALTLRYWWQSIKNLVIDIRYMSFTDMKIDNVALWFHTPWIFDLSFIYYARRLFYS